MSPEDPRRLWSDRAIRARRVLNWINLATPLGLAMARAGRATVGPGPHGLLLARDYRLPFPAPRAPAVTIGDVVLLRLSGERLARRPRLLDHEARHAFQYARWLGPAGFLPAYLLASSWSWLRCRDFALRNGFEVAADLREGGYLRPGVSSPSPRRRRRPDRGPR